MAILGSTSNGGAAPDRLRQEDRIGIVRQIATAWEKSGVSVKCELCAHSDWALVATEDADGIGFPLRRDMAVNLGRCYLAYAVECKNCGNIRVIGKSRVEELTTVDDTEE